MIPISSPVANYHNRYPSSPLMDSKNSSYKKSLILVDAAVDGNISYAGLAMDPNMTAGSPDQPWKTVKPLMSG